MKIRIEVKSCPWCKTRPNIDCPIMGTETWLWYIFCDNWKCKVRPKTRHVAVRNTKKYNLIALADKISTLADYWNSGLYTCAEHWLEIDLQKIIDRTNIKS